MATVDELRFSLGLRYDRQLASALGVKRQVVTRWRKRGIPPAKVAEAENILLRLRVQGLGGDPETIVISERTDK